MLQLILDQIKPYQLFLSMDTIYYSLYSVPINMGDGAFFYIETDIILLSEWVQCVAICQYIVLEGD